MSVVWNKAKRLHTKCSICIEGLSGTGKTGLALTLAYFLSGKQWDKIFAEDTEARSMDLFEGLDMPGVGKCGEFNKLDVAPGEYMPSTFVALREDAVANGAAVNIIDSASHSWIGEGGVLDTVTRLTEENAKVNNFNAWGKPEVRNEKNLLCMPDFWRHPAVHCITTVRLKEKFVQEGSTVRSVGEQQLMQDNSKYEPDLVLRMVSPGGDGAYPKATVEKSRYAFLKKDATYEFTPELCEQLVAYLDEGADPEELEKLQQENMVKVINEILKADKMKQAKFKMYKTSNGLGDIKLADMTLVQLNALYSYLQ